MSRRVLVLALAASTAALPRTRTGPSELAITVDGAYARVADVVRMVSSDGIVHGTFQYEAESGIGGAVPAESSGAFEAWTGSGQAFYKTRAGAIAPAHYADSNGRGTLTVRYRVEAVTPAKTRVYLDSVFVEEGRRRRHPSDGLVEAAEFDQIARELKRIDTLEKARQAEVERRRRDEEQQRLERELKSERARLAVASAAVTELETRLETLQRQVLARVRPATVEVKAHPFLGATTVRAASRGEVVRVLQRTAYWTRVETSGGQQGWIYGLLLEPWTAPEPAATLAERGQP